MDGQGLRMCRFTRDGIPELGEYLESVDGTGICKLTELDGGGEEVVVCLPDGTMPEGISDLELVRVPTRIEEGEQTTVLAIGCIHVSTFRIRDFPVDSSFV